MKPLSFEECATTDFPLHFPFTLGNPLSAYRPLLECLAEDYRVLPIHMRPLWPSTSINTFAIGAFFQMSYPASETTKNSTG